MKRLFILAVATIITGCATWTAEQKTLGGTSVVLDVIDYAQTKRCLSMPNCHETNTRLGEHPSNEKLAVFKAATSVAKLGLAEAVPKATAWLGVPESPMRTSVLLIFNFIQFKTDVRNAKIVGIKWGF